MNRTLPNFAEILNGIAEPPRPSEGTPPRFLPSERSSFGLVDSGLYPGAGTCSSPCAAYNEAKTDSTDHLELVEELDFSKFLVVSFVIELSVRRARLQTSEYPKGNNASSFLLISALPTFF